MPKMLSSAKRMICCILFVFAVSLFQLKLLEMIASDPLHGARQWSCNGKKFCGKATTHLFITFLRRFLCFIFFWELFDLGFPRRRHNKKKQIAPRWTISCRYHAIAKWSELALLLFKYFLAVLLPPVYSPYFLKKQYLIFRCVVNADIVIWIKFSVTICQQPFLLMKHVAFM